MRDKRVAVLSLTIIFQTKCSCSLILHLLLTPKNIKKQHTITFDNYVELCIPFRRKNNGQAAKPAGKYNFDLFSSLLAYSFG